MRQPLFGATGLTGIQLIELALVGGDRVIAYARTPSKISIRHERLVIVAGESSGADPIKHTVCGADAVICVLDPHLGGVKNCRLLTERMQNIFSAVQKTG